jgi:hypothetical protein
MLNLLHMMLHLKHYKRLHLPTFKSTIPLSRNILMERKNGYQETKFFNIDTGLAIINNNSIACYSIN